LLFRGQCRGSPFTISTAISLFRVMQRLSFYRFNRNFTFSGNAEALLLPFQPQFRFFGQCRASPFTISIAISLFRAMQSLSFYRFNRNFTFSGNAEPLLLPFQSQFHFFGQCRGSPFTVSTAISLFRAMQRLSFYRFNRNFTFSGNAEALLLPFQSQFHFFGQCRGSPFTVSITISLFRAMKRL
jgi:hypothetical protein